MPASTGRSTLLAVAILAALPWPALASAAALTDITVTQGADYTEVKLSFDDKPGYTESFRFDPDRYMLTLVQCRSALPTERAAGLSDLGGGLLSKISVRAGSENVELGFYLGLPLRPFIRHDERSYFLRFYTGTRVERVTALAPGVSLTEKGVTRAGENLLAYILRIDPSASAQVYSVAADRYDRSTRVRKVSSFARREGADVVINGGFFGANGQHLSTLVEDGIMRATGVVPTRPMLVVTPSGEPLIGRYTVNTSLVFTAEGGKAQSLSVSAKNYPFQSGKTIVYDSTYPLDTLPQEAMFYYAIKDSTLSFLGSTPRGLELGPGMLLLATDIMPEVNPLKAIPDGAAVKLETRITDSAGQTVLAASAIGGAPMLVENGSIELSVSEDKVKDDIAKSERSRTAVGITRSGQLMLVVVKEAENENYGGLKLKALAELLLAEGAWTAMNLDGGGSSAICVAGHLLNTAESAERAVSNVLCVKLGQAAEAASRPATQAQPGSNKYTPVR